MSNRWRGPNTRELYDRRNAASRAQKEKAMAASEELADQLEAEQRGHLVGLLLAYVEARGQANATKRHQDQIGDLFKDYLLKHPEEVLYDGETRIEASMKDRALPGRDYDLITLAEKDPVLFKRLLETGCLQVNDAAVRVQKAQVGGVERYAFPRGVTKALSVEVKQ